MPIQPCPSCHQQTPKLLHATSSIAIVNYYRCETCGHIWTIDKKDPSRMTHVTPLPETSPAKAI